MDEQLQFGDSDAVVALRKAWEKALALLAPEVNRPSFESFFRTAKPLSIEDGTATIQAASELARIFLDKYSELVSAALENSLGSPLKVVFTAAAREQPKEQAAQTSAPRVRQSGGIVSTISLPLNDKYIFPTFIVGPCNRLAHAAAVSAAMKPGKAYNPFFIYGGPGLGKTHLLQALGHSIMENHPKLRIAYVSGEMFTSHYVASLREHKSEDFRQRYRGIDVWLMDDIQFLAGKERTREEFFHTFNALYQTNKQIVISSDRSPRDLNAFEERLRSRFESGLVADLAPPDVETRIAILQNKAVAEEMDVPPTILECIAEHIPTNIRALEGALVTLIAYSSLMKAPLTIPLAQEVLARYLTEKKISELTPDAIQRAVAQVFGLEVQNLIGESRSKDLVTARHVAMYLCRTLTPCSVVGIGKAFGGRDHATVLHACRRMNKLLDQDDNLRATVENLADDLKSGRL